MKKAFAYLRVSGQGQVEGHGFDRQLKAVNQYAKRNKWQIEEVYREEGVSGTKGEDGRPAFMEMISEILRNGIDTVIVESLDRLARGYMIQEQLLIYLVSKKIVLINANTGENVTEGIQADPMRKAMIQMQGIFSELEKSLLVKKLRKARERTKKERGKCEGAKRYGEVSDTEAAVVRRIRALRRTKRGGRKGMTLQEIADKLNDEGISTKRGHEWGPSQIYRILQPKNSLVKGRR